MEAIRSYPKTIPADIYNHVRLGLLRLSSPLEVELIAHRGLVFRLDDKCWRCYETIHGERLVMMWQDFETSGRDALFEPVICRLSFYHKAAGLVMGSVLDELDELILKALEARGDGLSTEPSSINKERKT